MDPFLTENEVILSGSLYGEDEREADPEFVHIEDIITRSRLYDWQISPHSHQDMFQILFVKQGPVDVWLDGMIETVEAPCAVTIPSGVVHAFQFSPDTVGSVVTISDFLLTDARYQRSHALFQPLFEASRIIAFAKADSQAQRIGRILELMQMEFDWPEIGRASMFEWLLRILLMIIRRQMAAQQIPDSAKGYSRQMFRKFRSLIDQNFRDHWTIKQYADTLGLSQARLNRLCQSFRNQNAQQMVHDRLILEAQRLLIYTSASSAMVAYELGFQDPAYFSRFFKRQTGLAPGKFRSQQRARGAEQMLKKKQPSKD